MKSPAKKTARQAARKAAKKPDDKPTLAFPDAWGWSAWLETNSAKSSVILLRMAKKASGIRSITYAEALEVALAYGWIDGQSKSEGETHWVQKFTPRSARSIWSKRNREKALALIAAGEMKPGGLAEVERAKRDGRWDAAYDGPRGITVPADLQAALDKSKGAKSFFESLDSRNRFAILFRLQTAKKAETRARRLQQFVEMLRRREKIHP